METVKIATIIMQMDFFDDNYNNSIAKWRDLRDFLEMLRRDAQLQLETESGGVQVDEQDTERTTEIKNGK